MQGYTRVQCVHVPIQQGVRLSHYVGRCGTQEDVLSSRKVRFRRSIHCLLVAFHTSDVPPKPEWGRDLDRARDYNTRYRARYLSGARVGTHRD